MNKSFDDLLSPGIDIVMEASAIVRDNWNRPHDITHKGAIDLVTETDVKVQAFLREALSKLLPEANFIGEEECSANADPAKGLCWIVDPVDGTTNFVHRIPMVGVSVALCDDGRPVLGIIDAPMLTECFYAVKGGGAWLNGQRVQVSETASVQNALVATGFPYDPLPDFAGIMRRLANILPTTQGLRRLGAASLDLAYVACGRLDAFYECGLKPWDMAAGWLIVMEAGGMISDFNGAPVKFGAPLCASNGRVHEAILKLLTAGQ